MILLPNRVGKIITMKLTTRFRCVTELQTQYDNLLQELETMETDLASLEDTVNQLVDDVSALDHSAVTCERD